MLGFTGKGGRGRLIWDTVEVPGSDSRGIVSLRTGPGVRGQGSAHRERITIPLPDHSGVHVCFGSLGQGGGPGRSLPLSPACPPLFAHTCLRFYFLAWPREPGPGSSESWWLLVLRWLQGPTWIFLVVAGRQELVCAGFPQAAILLNSLRPLKNVLRF